MDYRVIDEADRLLIVLPIATVEISKDDWTVKMSPSALVRVSRHQLLVMSAIKQLALSGITELNADGIYGVPLNRSISLGCGEGRADIAYRKDGKTEFIEVETPDKLGDHATIEQLKRLALGSDTLYLGVPTAKVADARALLRLARLETRVRVLEIRES